MADQGTRRAYDELKQRGLKLDMSRGKPAPEQLALSAELLGGGSTTFAPSDGTDTRNYGGVLGLPEARALFGSLLDLPAAQVVVDGNSSLALMHDVIVYALLHGVPGPSAVEGAGADLVFVSGARLRSPLLDLRVARHPDDRRADGRARPRPRDGTAAGRRGRQHQGHVVRAQVQEPERHRVRRRRGRGAREHEDGGARLSCCSGTTRIVCTT